MDAVPSPGAAPVIGLQRALADAAGQSGPDTIALMRVLMEAASEAEGRKALAQAVAAAPQGADRDRLTRLQVLWAAHPRAWKAVRGTVDGIAHAPPQGAPEEVLAYWAAAFDRLVAAEPEASVALYSLGSPELLADATCEIVDRMAAWGLLTQNTHLLDLGCGIGRFLVALAPRVAQVIGRDVSPGMVAEARHRCSAFTNVNVATTTGQDLADIGDRTLDLVLAADVFPYLVGAGGIVAARHVADAARVLRPGGTLLILNWSYRGDTGLDQDDVERLAGASGFAIGRLATRDFALWDGVTFLLRKGGT